MTELTLFKSSNVPAHLRGAELSDTTKALMGGGAGGKRISIKGGVFRLVSGGKELAQIEDRHLDIIVVKAAPKVSRQFYSKGYDPEAGAQAPDCWSADGEKPDPSIAKPQHSACHNCPQNIAGSGRGESRACRYQQRLAVMVADDMESGVYQLALPATSLFGKEEGDKRPLQAYARYLAVQTPPVDIGSLVTRMKFDTRSESPKLFFSPVRWLTEDEYADAREAAATPEAAAAVSMTVFQTDSTSRPAPLAIEGVQPKATREPAPEAEVGDEPPAKPARARKPKAEPEAPNEEVVVVDEPEKRKPAAKAEAGVKKSLADIVGEWDDDDA